MSNNYFFSNKSFKSLENFEDVENNNNSLFMNNPEDNLLHSYNNEEDYDFNNNNNDINNISDLNSNEIYTDSLYGNNMNNLNLNLNFDNSIKFKNNNNVFPENNSLKDISSIEHNSLHKLDEDSNSNSNSNIINNISNNSSSTKDKSGIKNEININNNKKEINKENKENLNKKRKPRVHLEDLDIDPELIKDKKFQTIGDKVFLSKNKILTEEDKKEVRAIRNRISAQKSRDKKKAEFSLFKKQIKYLTAQLNQKILIIKNYEDICCPQCKSKLKEINQKIINENIDIDSPDINKDEAEEGLILEEDDNFPNKKNSILGKIPGLLIGLVCLIGISLCIFQFNINRDGNKVSLRNLKNYNNTDSNITVNITKNKNNSYEETFEIFEEPIVQNDYDNENYIKEIKEENDNELLQMCHDKFIFDVFTNTKKKKDQEEKQKSKTGFLVKKSYDKLDPNSFCFGSNTIINGEYYMNNKNLTNTLPIQRDNIILNEYISNKIISVFIKDYESLKKLSKGKILTLKEQIELGAKNSEDGCIYLQLIIPKNDIENDFKKNDTCPNDSARYFEVRCKILGYYNYYDGGV